MSSVDKFFADTPKINTFEMDRLLSRFTALFRGVKQGSSLWVCGRSSTFGLRPSLKQKLPSIMKEWNSSLDAGNIVITPLVFYVCKDDDPEQTLPDREGNPDEFLVYHHYNLLLSYLNAEGELLVERYEPADSRAQGNLNSRLETLLTEIFKRKISYRLVAPVGLQTKYGDKTLCGHHILYWMIYRLKHGEQKALQLLEDAQAAPKFIKFCTCLTEFREGEICAESI